MRHAVLLIGICCLGMLPGCSTTDPPLIFGKVNTFGLSASATAPDQGGNVVLGYRSANLAIVPVTARDGFGNMAVLKEVRAGGNDGALSTFSHFEASAGAGAGVKACLGDTFATGLAAQVIAQKLERVCRP